MAGLWFKMITKRISIEKEVAWEYRAAWQSFDKWYGSMNNLKATQVRSISTTRVITIVYFSALRIPQHLWREGLLKASICSPLLVLWNWLEFRRIQPAGCWVSNSQADDTVDICANSRLSTVWGGVLWLYLFQTTKEWWGGLKVKDSSIPLPSLIKVRKKTKHVL